MVNPSKGSNFLNEVSGGSLYVNFNTGAEGGETRKLTLLAKKTDGIAAELMGFVKVRVDLQVFHVKRSDLPKACKEAELLVLIPADIQSGENNPKYKVSKDNFFPTHEGRMASRHELSFTSRVDGLARQFSKLGDDAKDKECGDLLLGAFNNENSFSIEYGVKVLLSDNNSEILDYITKKVAPDVDLGTIEQPNLIKQTLVMLNKNDMPRINELNSRLGYTPNKKDVERYEDLNGILVETENVKFENKLLPLSTDNATKVSENLIKDHVNSREKKLQDEEEKRKKLYKENPKKYKEWLEKEKANQEIKPQSPGDPNAFKG